MANAQEPSLDLARRTLPAPLFRAIQFLFSKLPQDGCCLVGGTALAGFYAGHRKSDDIDLFTQDTFTFDAAMNAALALEKLGASIQNVRKSVQHFHCLAELDNHRFTIDIVLDSHFFSIPNALTKAGNITLATLSSLLRMKLATLVSRCSEKDLYDLIWLFDKFYKPKLNEIVPLGASIDTGVSEESILLSTSGTKLKQESCHFAEPSTSAADVHKQINRFLNNFNRDFAKYTLNKEETLPLQDVYKKLT